MLKRSLSRGRHGGFTLVEALAAIVLIAIVMPVVMHGFSLATALGDTAKRRAEAATLAHSVLSELTVTKAWQTGTVSGEFETHPDYRWQCELLAWDDSTLQQLSVRVYWTSGGLEQSLVLTTLVNVEAN